MSSAGQGLSVEKSAEIERALEVFARGFTFTRSFTHPYLAERIGPVWVLRDGPRRNNDYRNEEWVAYGVPPGEVDKLARRHTRGRYAICALHSVDEPDEPLRAGYKALGYRLRTTEPLMVHDLKRIRRCESPAVVRRVMTEEMAARLAKAAGSKQILKEYLGDGTPMRQYVALINEEPVGWVRSIVTGDGVWCSSMYVLPAFRRKGIARALLCRALRDDRAAGANLAVLLSTHAGARLYPVVGYRQIGTLLLFGRKK